MPEYHISYTLRGADKVSVRDEVIKLFTDTEKDTGGPTYWYTVESFDGYSIRLKRPGYKRQQPNPNFTHDFQVSAPGVEFKTTGVHDAPRHDDIVRALGQVKNANPAGYRCVEAALEHIYRCQPNDRKSVQHLSFGDIVEKHHPIEIVILATKWIFIEEDLNYPPPASGREMFWDKLKAADLIS